MARPSKPHRNSGKWRFRWTIQTETETAVIHQAIKLRGLSNEQSKKLKPRKTEKGYSLSWAVVRAHEADINSEFDRYKKITTSNAPVLIMEAVERYEAHANNKWVNHIIAPMVDFDGWLLLSEVKPNYLARYAKWLIGQGYSEETRRKQVRYGMSVFQHAVDEGWMSQAPKSVRLPQPQPQPKAYSRQELAELFRTFRIFPADVDPEEKKRMIGKPAPRVCRVVPMLRLALATGMRIGEIRQLRWNQVNLSARLITLEPSAHKGGKRSQKIRVVRLNKKAMQLIQRQKGNHVKYVFVSKRDGQPYSRDGLNAILYRPNRKIRPHRLRHTFIQRAIDAGVAPHMVAEMVGHQDSKLVWMYAKIKDEQVFAAYELLDGQGRPGHERQSPPALSA